MNNIIFLDIDGVLKHPTKNSWYTEAIACLNAYCSHNNIDIVISSTWRLIKDIEFFNKILNNRVVGVTRDLSDVYKEHTRHYECKDYVVENHIINYVMVDDKSSEYYEHSRNVIVDSHTGISLKTIMDINTILNKSINYLIDEEIILQEK
jgi:16S rRNA C1402 (ribose-2'-O) methylase RsmI